MKTIYILQGIGTGYKGRKENQFVQSICDGGCAITLNGADAMQFDTEAEAQAIIDGRHACGNFSVIPFEADNVNEAGDTKYRVYTDCIGSPSFDAQYDAGRNEVVRLIRAGQRAEAKELCIKLTEWNQQHNAATVTAPQRTLDQAIAATKTNSKPGTPAAVSFSLFFEAGLIQIQYLTRVGKVQQADELRQRLTALNEKHNAASSNAGRLYIESQTVALAA